MMNQAVEGAQIAFGRRCAVHPQFDKAAVVVALDSDFLGVDSPTVLPTKQFAKRPKLDGEEAIDQPLVRGGEQLHAHRRRGRSPFADARLGRAGVRARSRRRAWAAIPGLNVLGGVPDKSDADSFGPSSKI